MAKLTRGGLHTILKTFAKNALEHDDQMYGRQLATICEQVAATLRVRFGGKSLLLVPRAPSAKKVAQSQNGIAKTLQAYTLAYGHPDPTPEWLADAMGLKVQARIVQIIERVRKCRFEAQHDTYAPKTDELVIGEKTHTFPLWPVDNL